MSVIENVLREIWTANLLGAERVDYGWDTGADCFRVVLRTGDQVDVARIAAADLDVADPGGVVEKIDRILAEARDRHFLASYNVWPGWRI